MCFEVCEVVVVGTCAFLLIFGIGKCAFLLILGIGCFRYILSVDFLLG